MDLEVCVQLVRRLPPARTYWLVVHPVAPRCGRRDLRDWLQDGGWQAQLDAVRAGLVVLVFCLAFCGAKVLACWA